MNLGSLTKWYAMSYTDYAETGSKCVLCGKKMFRDGIEVEGGTVCSEWCVTEYERRNDGGE